LLVRVAHGREVFLEAALGLQQSLRARARDRPGLFGALLVKALARGPQPALSAVFGRHDLRQLVAAALTESGGLGGVGRDGLLDDRAGDLLIATAVVLSRMEGAASGRLSPSSPTNCGLPAAGLRRTTDRIHGDARWSAMTARRRLILT
jgi:hypothetical protein